MNTKRVAIYVRLSRYRGVDDPSTSPIRQREACGAYAAAQGWDVVDVFEDLDVSGGEKGLRLDRPGLREIRDRFGDLDVVIFLNISRLARSVVDFSTFASEAAAQGVALVSVRDGLDLSTPGGRFVAQILSAFAEMELATITERVLDGRRKSRELGRWQGGVVPVGLRVGADRALEVAEDEAEILRRVADVILAGGSVLAACRELQASALPPRRSERWTNRSVRRLLTSKTHAPMFLGVERAHLVKEMLGEPNTEGKTTNPSRILSGLLACSGCGSRMYAASGSGYGQTYKCHAAQVGSSCPRAVTIKADLLDAWAEESYLARVGDFPELISVRVSDERVARIAELTASTKALASGLSSLRGGALREAADELDRQEAELAELQARRGSGLSALRETGRTHREAWEVADLRERREILRRFLAPSGFLTIGPGRPGVKGLQVARVLDEWKITAAEVEVDGTEYLLVP